MSSPGRHRWWCHSCRRGFSWSTGRVNYQRQFVWFQRWITQGYTIGQLVKHSGHSRATIQRILDYWLRHPPETDVGTIDNKYILFDGTYLHHRHGMFAAMDGVTHRIMCGVYGMNEGPRDLLIFCQSLNEQGLHPISATIDGNPHVFRAIQLLWPTIMVQRCLVHIQRQGLSWCRQHPKRPNAQHLRRIFRMVLNIHTHAQVRQFVHTFDRWNEQYGTQLANSSNRGWVTNDLQKAQSMLTKALPYMFVHLFDEKIPRSTNALEGYFSRLKHRYRQHRGLSKQHRPGYFKWYFNLVPK